MKQILLMIAVVALVGCGEKIADPIVKGAIRHSLKKTEGQLTEADLTKVTSLVLDSTKITDEGLKDVAKLQGLEMLNLDSCEQVTDEGLKEVAKLQLLEMLNLSGTEITDAGLKEFVKFQNLKVLYLESTKTTDAGVAELRKALPKCEIDHRYKKD